MSLQNTKPGRLQQKSNTPAVYPINVLESENGIPPFISHKYLDYIIDEWVCYVCVQIKARYD